MTWYAIAISPSSTRMTAVIKLSRGPKNGLRQERTYSATHFQIETDLAASGFRSYVPADTMSVRDRKSGKYALRRFPMLRGYAFIESPHDWVTLEGVRGVSALLGSGGIPICVPEADIAVMRMAELDCQTKAESAKAARDKAGKRMTRRMAGETYPQGMIVEIDEPTLGRQIATIDSTTGRGTVRAMAHFLGGLVPVEVPMTCIREIAA